MFNQIGRWLDPILLIGLFVSIAVGIGMVLTGNDTTWGLTIGLLSTIVTLLVDIIARIQKVEDSVIDAAELSRILSDESIGKTLRQIANSYAAIKKYNFAHYRTIADTVIDECQSKLGDIASGSVLVTTKTIQEYAILGIKQAHREIKAVHIGSMDFWSSSFGNKVFDLNRAAVERGVQITRVFALTNEEARNSIEVLEAQEQAGIQVLVVSPDHVNHEFTLFDDRVLVVFPSDEGNYRRERIVLDPVQVNKRAIEFQRLAMYAKTIQDTISTD